jgi:hypothetical protein
VVVSTVITSDNEVWNEQQVIADIVEAAVTNQPITLDLIAEGPDFHELDIVDFILDLPNKYHYDLQNITVKTCNAVESSTSGINMQVSFPYHFVLSTQRSLQEIAINKNFSNTFGMFIGRSNQHRLDLSAYLFTTQKNKTLQTFHYDKNNDYHRANLGLDKLVASGLPASSVSSFIDACPILADDKPTYPILMDQHCNLSHHYNSFFVEIVCETFFSGNTFFPTEKTWRSIALGTPFIVQGPQYFLHRLRGMGFKTFENWWDEGYAEDPANHQCFEIKRVIDYLGEKTHDEIDKMYQEMRPVLEHNRNLFFSLTEDSV